MKNEYPKLMEVSDDNFKSSYIRVVIAHNQNVYIAWMGAKTFEEAENETEVSVWKSARDIDPYRELKEAYEQGKVIQANMGSRWEDIKGEPVWNDDVKHLRIKPEPKCIPFDYSDADKMIGKVVKLKSSVVGIITAVYCDESVIVGNVPYTFKELFNDFTFFDGSVCGKP